MAGDEFEMIEKKAPGSNICVQQEETDHTNIAMSNMDEEEEQQHLSPNGPAGRQEEEPDHTDRGMSNMGEEEKLQGSPANGYAGGQEEQAGCFSRTLSFCNKNKKAIIIIGFVISNLIAGVVGYFLGCFRDFSFYWDWLTPQKFPIPDRTDPGMSNMDEEQKLQGSPANGYADGQEEQAGKYRLSNCTECPPDWIQHQGHCYKFSEEEKNWNESQNFCILHNASLARITKEEMDFIKILIGDDVFWIGLKTGQSWKWLDGDNATLEVKGHGGDCAYLDNSGIAYAGSCINEHRYICKKNEPKRS